MSFYERLAKTYLSLGEPCSTVTELTAGLYRGGRSEITLEQCSQGLRSGGLQGFSVHPWDCFHCIMLCVCSLQPQNLLLQVVFQKERICILIHGAACSHNTFQKEITLKHVGGCQRKQWLLFISASLWYLFSFKRGLSISLLGGPVQENTTSVKEMGCKTIGNAPMMGQEGEATAKHFRSKGQKGRCLNQEMEL